MPTQIQTNKRTSRRLFLGGIVASVVAVSLMAPVPAFADKLDDLRVKGVVGEAFDGYARARDKSAKAEVSDINAKRRTIYEKRAKSQKVSVEQVGQVYAVQIAKKAPSGTWFLSQDGKWSQK